MSRLLGKIIKNNKGQILPMMALGLAVLIGFAAISVDYGYLAWQKRSLQNAADAGALSAAWELPNPGGIVIQAALDDEAEYYTNEHVATSFKSATPINNNEAVTVEAEKDYDRIFFSRIFAFFGDATTFDRLGAEATAERFVYFWDGLLPFSSLERYDYLKETEEAAEDIDIGWQTEVYNYFDSWSTNFDEYYDFQHEKYQSYLDSIDFETIDDDDDLDRFKSEIDYFDYFMHTLKGSFIDFRVGSGTSPANYGHVFLPTEDAPDGAQPLAVIRGSAGQLLNIVDMDLSFKMGWVAAIENPGDGQFDLSDKLDELNGKGYIIAVLPSKVDATDPSEDKLVEWGDYLILELEEIEINYIGNNNNQVDTDNPVTGKLVNSYNIFRGERPNTSFNDTMRIGSILIKP